jgi:3-hydroxybutyryl-CoA dehydrogenase
VRVPSANAGPATSSVAKRTAADDLASAADAELAVEAITEQLEAKRTLMTALRAAAPSVALATNTSSYRVADLAVGVTAPERILALHLFNPAASMRLVEVRPR